MPNRVLRGIGVSLRQNKEFALEILTNSTKHDAESNSIRVQVNVPCDDSMRQVDLYLNPMKARYLAKELAKLADLKEEENKKAKEAAQKARAEKLVDPPQLTN